MANGIDSIYDPSDVSRMLAELREQRIQMEKARAKKTEGATRVGTSAWKLWSGEQTAKTKELLASKDYVIDPKYTEKNWLSRQFTPAGGRVLPSEEFAGRLKDWERTGKIISDGSASMRLPGGEVVGSAPIPKDIRGFETISESIKQPISGYFSRVAEKGSGLGGGIGAGLSLYETVSDWEKHDPKQRDVRRGIDIGKTGLYAASMVPGPHAPFTLAGAGALTLADLLWS